MTDCGVVCDFFLNTSTDDHRVTIDPVDNPPCHVGVHDSQLVAALADSRHRSRVGHFEALTGLESPEQESGFKPCLLGEGRRLHFAVQPDKRFVSWGYENKLYANSDILSTNFSAGPNQRLQSDGLQPSAPGRR